ncbi:hypothetical protein [Mycolicibacter kumamotonensis]|uniref:Uncharacterized protein n=1 Tax=Mycolicibacter kumamotonensis TaxID=354243 RepID=A0A1B8S9C4_9MYCO|nr:hypothetical protein [Mycolicibacter kumamotonensis]OBY29272.1 hypothetical protein ACT18_23945 [Mycolicibacter kumamotonensis]
MQHTPRQPVDDETHGTAQLGALRIREVPTSRADAHLKGIASVRQAQQLRVVLKGSSAWVPSST